FAKTLYFRLFALIGDLTGWILGVFSLTGLIILFLTDENRRVKLWYICGALLFLFSSMIVYDRHYSVILLLFILPLTVRPFVTGAIGRLLDKRAIMPVLVLFIVFTVVHLIISLDKNGKTVNGEPRHLIPLAEHIRSTITDKGSILSVRSLFPVRLGFSHTGYDKKIEDWQTLLDYAKEKKCKYLLADYPEYNTMPFMRFLSNDEMTAPKGAVQVVRNGLVALYKFSDTSSIDTAINAKKYEIQDILTIYGSAVRSPISPDSVRAFLMSAIKKGVPEKVAIPPFQVVTRNQGNGFERFGFVFKSSTGALVSANLTTPPSGGVQTSGKPAVLLLPGMEREGKANPLCINTAENLARAGAFVLSIDRSGTGERIGVQYSHSAILLNSAAAGHAPAEQFILEAMEASMLLPNFTGIQTDSFSVVGIGADSWSALYLSIINKKVKNIGFVGGLTSSIDMAISNERPLQAAIPSLASKCDLPTFFSALPTAKIYLVSLGGNHNMYYGSLVSNGKGTMYQFTASDSFIPLTYAPFIKGFCKGLDLQQIEPAFTYNKEEAANYTASIGSDQIASNTPLLFSYPVDDRFDTTKAPEKSASQKAVKKGDKTIIIRLYSSQTGPAVQSDAKGDKVIEVPIQLTEVYSSYRDNVNQFYDELINGTAAINLITNKINSLRDKYSGSLYIAAEDTIAAYAALKIMTSSYGFADRIFLPFLPDMRPSRLIDGILSGYDGSPYSTANMENNRNLALYRLIYHFGNFDPVEAINDAADCGTVIYTTQEKDEGFFEKVNYLKTKNEF
ncbi:MAG: hypothetical protein JNL74_07125, partial [Fibrobacteres bacterium]|nr:hypothetical protein [Fibrobacterota bacterium]